MTTLSHSKGTVYKFQFLYFIFLCDDCSDDTEAGPLRLSAGNQAEYSRMSLSSASAGLFYTCPWTENTLSLGIVFLIRVSYSDREANEILDGPNITLKL